MNSALQGVELPLTYIGSLICVIDLSYEQWVTLGQHVIPVQLLNRIHKSINLSF